eukprot:4760499-Prymnesium_polylepis.1
MHQAVLACCAWLGYSNAVLSTQPMARTVTTHSNTAHKQSPQVARGRQGSPGRQVRPGILTGSHGAPSGQAGAYPLAAS